MKQKQRVWKSTDWREIAEMTLDDLRKLPHEQLVHIARLLIRRLA